MSHIKSVDRHKSARISTADMKSHMWFFIKSLFRLPPALSITRSSHMHFLTISSSSAMLPSYTLKRSA